ncbi:uncharacterized protein VTP21DRAFT_7157 [Calcarisporiella thermophila]|uniref:uncharacterized protein n=1 Tax=Calcarisporiella thermophila TaxID=911321 RepID=UPI0037432226
MYQPFLREGENDTIEPHWDDVLRFPASRFRPPISHNRRDSATASFYDTSDGEDDEENRNVEQRRPLLGGNPMHPSRKLVSKLTKTLWKRAFVLNLFPAAVAVAWCSIPLPFKYLENMYPGQPPGNRTYSDAITLMDLKEGTCNGDPEDDLININFWFFLFFYFGFYNAIALLLITKIFNIYSLNWWPKSLGGRTAYLIFWLLSLGGGVIIHYFTRLEQYNLTWVFNTFGTMTIPPVLSIILIHRQSRNIYRGALTEAQKTFSTTSESLMPASYKRFLWFCLALFMLLVSLVAGETYTYIFINWPPNSSLETFIYVYSWVATIYLLDAIAEYVVEYRVKSYPLLTLFKLYFFTVYFVFYRNLFAQFRSPQQFAWIQAGASLWVCIFYPICMTRTTHWLLVRLVGLRRSYEEYKLMIGRSFYLRNLAENTTMIAFLCWVTILHFGPNRAVYPYFQFCASNNINFNFTLFASLVVWSNELASSFVTRLIFRHLFRLDVTREAIHDFKRYPDLIVALVLVMIHVMQDMLFALLKLSGLSTHA